MMSKINTLLLTAIVLAFASLGLAGCEEESDTFEDIGEDIDNRVGAVRDSVESAINEAEERLEELDE
ncbi:MAG: hypothetical protein ACR2QQ_08080 [Gammaproteobacteria bacterium]